MIRFCLSFTRNVFKKNLTYRFGYYTDLLSIILSIAIQYFIWESLLGEGWQQTSYGVIDLPTMCSYATVSALTTYATTSFLLDNVSSRVLKGTIALDLLRPVSLKTILFCESAGLLLFRTIFVALPLGAIVFFFLGLPVSTPEIIALSSLSLFNGFVLTFLVEYAVGVLSFWFTQVHSLGVLLWTSISFFSGALIPLWFFPPSIEMIANVLPFKFMRFVPAAIFAGTYTPNECISLILQQGAWIVAIYVIGHIAYDKGIRKLTIMGG